MKNELELMIIDNLRKAGVQNTRKNERLVFERLDPYAGEWLHAAGEFTSSRPFDPPATGKIAIKVINHYGDEVLKVYEVG